MNNIKQAFNWYNSSLSKKLDKKYPDGIAGFRPMYLILHPYKIFGVVGSEIKWAWQRVFRGWDDRAVWSADVYLSNLIAELLTELKEKKYGVPGALFKEEDFDGTNDFSDETIERVRGEWDSILDTIIDGFKKYEKPYYNMSVPEEAFYLFQKYFSNLWW